MEALREAARIHVPLGRELYRRSGPRLREVLCLGRTDRVVVVQDRHRFGRFDGDRGNDMTLIGFKCTTLVSRCSGVAARSVLLTLFSLLLMSCGRSGNAPVHEVGGMETTGQESAPTPSAPRVALIMKTLTNPFFVEMEKGARKAQPR